MQSFGSSCKVVDLRRVETFSTCCLSFSPPFTGRTLPVFGKRKATRLTHKTSEGRLEATSLFMEIAAWVAALLGTRLSLLSAQAGLDLSTAPQPTRLKEGAADCCPYVVWWLLAFC